MTKGVTMYLKNLVTILLALGLMVAPTLPGAHAAPNPGAYDARPVSLPALSGERSGRRLWATHDAVAIAASTPVTPCTWPSNPPLLFADTAAHYWLAVVWAHPSITLTVRGVYPAARYASLQVYSATTGAYLAGLTDTNFPPDAGATNPFVDGSARGLITNTFTMHVVFTPAPIQPAAGTLYVNVPAGTWVSLTYRIFLPDATASATGNVPLPGVTAAWTSGTPINCPQLIIPFSSTPGPPATPPPSAPAPPAFIRVSGQQLGGYGNGDTAYLYAKLPPTASLDVIRFTPPTTPHTLNGGPLDPSAQLRYWSLCAYTAAELPWSCLADEQLPRDAAGRVTVVFGPWWARPTNATAVNGVTFVSLGWFTSPFYLLLRHMVSNPAFTESAFAVPMGSSPNTANMGVYAPTVIVCTTTQFQQGSCSG